MNNKVKISELNNGLKYLVSSVPNMKSVTVLGLVGAGTRYETLKNNGISHFLEHMVFKGTKKYPTASDIAVAIDEVGGSFNAYTSKEYTGFYVKVAVNHLDLALSMVSQLTMKPLIPEKELEIERGVILEEIRMYEDQPQLRVGQLFEETLFSNQTIGWNTLGKAENIRNLKRQDFVEYMDYLYTPNRMTVSIAGGVNQKEIDGKVAKFFGEKKNLVKVEMEKSSFEQDEVKIGKIKKKTEQCHVICGFRTFSREDKRRYALSVLGTILGGGMSSRLFTEIREKRGLAYYVGGTANRFMDTGYIGMRAGTKPESYEEVLKITDEEFEKLKTKKVSEKEIKKAKEFIKGHLYLQLEDSYEIADFYGEDLLMEGKIRSVEDVVSSIDKVNAEDLQNLAREIFVDERKAIAVIGPESCI